MLIDQREEEKKEIDKASGKQQGQDLMRMPVAGETHGQTDMEKLGINRTRLAKVGGPPQGPPPSFRGPR